MKVYLATSMQILMLSFLQPGEHTSQIYQDCQDICGLFYPPHSSAQLPNLDADVLSLCWTLFHLLSNLCLLFYFEFSQNPP